MTTETLRKQLAFTLEKTEWPQLGGLYRGKVRDVYTRKDCLVIVSTDRLSAFDRVLTTLPFKGDLLNQLSVFWFQHTREWVPNHLVDSPDACVSVVTKAEPFPIEFVVRGYLTGSLWRDYAKGANPYALALPPGLQQNQAFESPLLTPSTKAASGEHDLPISEKDVVASGRMSAKHFAQAKEAALALFAAGQALAAQRGLILVDTKYEFGLAQGKLLAIDEMHTPDSSRYWRRQSYEERFAKGLPQEMLDKENLRRWLLEEMHYQGNGPIPPIPDDIRLSLARAYLDAFLSLTGAPLSLEVGSVHTRIEKHLRGCGLLEGH
ncbi:MAG: phosphoribosylaminoimidazolesuccinocarboxamide synthase [Proteobacteria bacterium]|nr:phosphoribosylaminoimidazolesuccinocarboxamide synthase [Cystobacterineae bacterium]MCL2313820.1 phosphoribosylaminoimidazolesuccinocarboxamide synthase [Pseudomonadota bacterium]